MSAQPITFGRNSYNRWGGIQFDGRGTAPLHSELRHCVLIELGRVVGYGIQLLNHSNFTLANSLLTSCDNWGIYCDDTSAPTIQGNAINACNGYPLGFKIDNPPALAGNTYSSNGAPWIYVYGNVGTSVILPYDGLPYARTVGDIDIYSGATLTLLPGTSMQFDDSQGINVGWNPFTNTSDRGALVANGTALAPIQLTKRGYNRWKGILIDGRD